MYWGSVRFYKHIIISALVLLLLVPSILAVNLFIENNRLTKELHVAKSENFAKLLSAQGREVNQALQIAAENSERNRSAGDHEFDLQYQNLYPDLFIGDIPKQAREPDMIYLTFDDGPSPLTEKVLDVLKEKNVKATFFVIGRNLESERGKSILKRIVQEGHSVGVHSYSHVYSQIYDSIENYLEDFFMTYEAIKNITGVEAEIFRFPGGSINGYSSTIYKELISELLRRGFVYYDWNVSSQDAARNTSVQQIHKGVVSGVKHKTRSIILMHDSSEKYNTLKALPQVIDELVDGGYSFDVLTRNVAPIVFGYSD